MKFYTRIVATLLFACAFVATADAQLYWDIDADLGAGGTGSATPAGTWDAGTTAAWNINSDGSGAIGVWADGSDAVFAAGTDATGAYTVTLGGAVSANTIAVEEGSVAISGANQLDINGTGTIDVASGASASIGSVVGGSAVVTKTGAGTLDLTNANLFSGMTLSGGTLRVNNITALGLANTSVIIQDGTTLSTTGGTARTLTYSYSTTGNFTLGQASGGTAAVTLAGTMDLFGSTRTITVNNAADTISAVISGTSAGITKEGTGTLTLSGANTYTGPVTVNAGILAASNATSLGPANSSTTTVASSATLQVSGGITINEKINLSGTGSTGTNGAIRKTGNNTTALQGQLTGSGDIMVTTGTLRLTATSGGGDNAGFTGPITVTGGGTLRFELISPNQLGTGNVITLDNGTLQNDNTSVPGNGSMLNSSKTITLGAGGGTLEYNTAGGLSIVNPTSIISGTGGLTKTGVGNIGISAPCTYGGPTHVVAGFLKVRASNERFPNASALTIDTGATFDVDGLTETMGSLAGAGTLEINGGSFLGGSDNTSTLFSGVITGSGAATNLTKQGTGTLTLSGVNTYTGVTAISAGGAIRVQDSAALGTTAGATTVASGAALEIDGSGLTIDDPMTIAGTGISSGGAIRNLANDNSMAGAIGLSGNARISSDAGTLSMSGTVKSSTATSRNLTVAGAGNVTLSNVVGDPAATNPIGTLTKNDGGILTLSAAAGNSYTGTTAVNGGTLIVTNTSGSATGSGAVTVASGATLAGTGIISGAITNNGTIAPGASVGTLTAGSDVISGANSHWAIELSGATADLLAVGGNIDLSAVDALDITGSGTGPWVISTYVGNLLGTFDTVTSGYSVNYGAGTNSQITLSVAAGLPGDFNSNGIVDTGDYVIWRKNETANVALPNDNGLATQADRYTLWRSQFDKPNPGSGSGSGLNGTAGVPEPSIIGLLAIGMMAPAFRRRR